MAGEFTFPPVDSEPLRPLCAHILAEPRQIDVAVVVREHAQKEHSLNCLRFVVPLQMVAYRMGGQQVIQIVIPTTINRPDVIDLTILESYQIATYVAMLV